MKLWGRWSLGHDWGNISNIGNEGVPLATVGRQVENPKQRCVRDGHAPRFEIVPQVMFGCKGGLLNQIIELCLIGFIGEFDAVEGFVDWWKSLVTKFLHDDGVKHQAHGEVYLAILLHGPDWQLEVWFY